METTKPETVSTLDALGSQMLSKQTPVQQPTSSGNLGSIVTTTNDTQVVKIQKGDLAAHKSWLQIATPSKVDLYISLIQTQDMFLQDSNSTTSYWITQPTTNIATTTQIGNPFALIGNQTQRNQVLNSVWNQHSRSQSRPDPAFNRFLNASDMLEEFIKFCGQERVSKTEFLNLPIKLFMMWLVLSAAEEDEMEPPQDIVARFKRDMESLDLPGDLNPENDQESVPEQDQRGQDSGDHVPPEIPLDRTPELIASDS